MTTSKDYGKLYEILLTGTKCICAFQNPNEFTRELDFFNKALGIISYFKKETVRPDHRILRMTYPDTIMITSDNENISNIIINENKFDINGKSLFEIFNNQCVNLLLEFIV